MATVKSDFVRSQHQRLAERIVELQYARQPEIWKPLGHPGREKSVRDAGYHLIYLAEALEADDPTLFSEYLAWVKILFASLKFPAQVLPPPPWTAPVRHWKKRCRSRLAPKPWNCCKSGLKTWKRPLSACLAIWRERRPLTNWPGTFSIFCWPPTASQPVV